MRNARTTGLNQECPEQMGITIDFPNQKPGVSKFFSVIFNLI